MPPEQPGRPRWGRGTWGVHVLSGDTCMDHFEVGSDVTVMSTSDAAEVLALLERLARDVPRLIQPSKLEQDAHALLSRLRGRR